MFVPSDHCHSLIANVKNARQQGDCNLCLLFGSFGLVSACWQIRFQDVLILQPHMKDFPSLCGKFESTVWAVLNWLGWISGRPPESQRKIIIMLKENEAYFHPIFITVILKNMYYLNCKACKNHCSIFGTKFYLYFNVKKYCYYIIVMHYNWNHWY